MSTFAIIFTVILSIVAIILVIVGIQLVRVLLEMKKFLRAANRVVDVSEVELQTVIADSLDRLVSRMEINEELVESMLLIKGGKKVGRKKQKRQLFRGL